MNNLKIDAHYKLPRFSHKEDVTLPCQLFYYAMKEDHLFGASSGGSNTILI